MTILLFAALAAAVYAMHWGASQVADSFRSLCRRWGLAATGGGALLGLATASPEISINIAAVGFGWPDLGLGTALGSNAPALPLVFAVSWLAGRKARASDRPKVQEPAARIQAAPYLLVVLLLALLTLPPWWRGLQPVDSVLLLGAYGLFLAQALLRERREPCHEPLPRGARRRLPLGGLAIAGGAVVSVLSAHELIERLGISDLLGGLFLTGLLCAMPETFAAWRLARKGMATAAVSGTMADGTASLSVALLALGLAGTPIGNLALYMVHLGFIALVLVLYMLMTGREGTYILGRNAAAMAGAYLFYLGAVAMSA